MFFLYKLFIHVYYLGILVASLYNNKAKLWITGRQDIFEKLGSDITCQDRVVWFHAASLGEFEQGRPVIEAVKEKFPDYKILLTFFSPSGYEIRKNYKGADFVYYLPLDLKKNVSKFLKIVNPRFAIFIKYEFWFNYVNQLEKLQIPLYIVSANFRIDQHFFKWYGSWFRKNLLKVNWFFVQNEKSKNLLKSIGLKNVTVSGDTRFDRVVEIARNPQKFELLESFTKENVTLLAGSTWYEDEKLLHQFFTLNSKKLKLIIAPHEIHEDHILQIENLFNKYKTIRFSGINSIDISENDIIIIDGMGFLSNLYQYCQVAYIGGGFGKGIHNILEAVTFGKPVIFGPNYRKFSEAVQLVEQGGAFVINNVNELCNTFDDLSKQELSYNRSVIICKEFIESQKGATSIILDKLSENKS